MFEQIYLFCFMQPPVFVKRTSSEVVIYINNTTQNKMFASDMTRQWGVLLYLYIWEKVVFFRFRRGGGCVIGIPEQCGNGPRKNLEVG